MWKQFLSDYFNFSKKERVGVISIFILIIIFLALPFFYAYFRVDPVYDHKSFAKEIESISIKQRDSIPGRVNRNFDESNYQNYYQPSDKDYYPGRINAELFYFDPNTLPDAGWKKLGIRDKTVQTIRNYLSKGGKFNKPEDIGKIWGLHKDDVNRLLPFIRIESVTKSDDNRNTPGNIFTAVPKPAILNIDINTADTAAFISLPGIGSKLANRIIAFREKLGGFYSVEQVAETYALPDSTFQKIREKLFVGSREIRKININTATTDELKIHPYIRYNIANAIVQYRLIHGPFTSLTDLKKIMIITDEIFNKASAYLTISN